MGKNFAYRWKDTRPESTLGQFGYDSKSHFHLNPVWPQPVNDPDWPGSPLFSSVSVLSGEPLGIDWEGQRLWNDPISHLLKMVTTSRVFALKGSDLFLCMIHRSSVWKCFELQFLTQFRFKKTLCVSGHPPFSKRISWGLTAVLLVFRD